MRWTSSVLNLSVAPMLKLTGCLLSCPLLHGRDRLHGSSWRFLPHRRCRFRRDGGGGSRRLLFRETLLEGFHQVNHGSHMRLGHFGHFLAFELGGNHRAYIFLILVPIFLRFEWSRKTLDKLPRELFFLLFHFDLIGRNGFGRANLIGIEHRVQRHALGPWPDNHDVFTLMHGELGDGSVTGLLHSLHEQLISLRPSVLRGNVIRGVEVQRVHLLQLHELQNLHHARRGRLDLVEFLFAEQHVLILFVFVALHNFRPFHVAIANGTKQGLLEARVALLVELVEANSFAASRRSHADGHRNQAKREVAFPDGRSHIGTPSTAALWPCAIFLRLAALRARSKMHPYPVMLILQSRPGSGSKATLRPTRRHGIESVHGQA